MPNIEVKQLYNHNRFPNKALSLLLYLPIGIVLVLFRLIIFIPIFLLCSVLPNTQLVHKVLLKLLCFTFGISINVENIEKKEDVDAYISNQLSIFDNLVIHSITKSIKPTSEVDTHLSPLLGVKYFGSMTNFESFKNSIALFISRGKTPMYFQPESAVTNGKSVLKFNTWPFTLCSKFQPIIIDIQRPFFNISVSALESTYWSDVFFFMFSPLTVYNIQFLPSMEKKGFSETDLAKKMQEEIALALKIEAVEHTSSDMKEWLKKYRLEKQRAQMVHHRPPTTSLIINTELQRMGLQVKEVLPMVPFNDILKDLMKTRNVDITITNILEGTVHYIPEQPVSGPSTSSSNTSSSSSPYPVCARQGTSKDPFNTAADKFGKSASERSLSFQDRKAQLIENARKRYMEKHGLNLVALNNC